MELDFSALNNLKNDDLKQSKDKEVKLNKVNLYKITIEITSVLGIGSIYGGEEKHNSETIITNEPNKIDITKAVADAVQAAPYKVKDLTVNVTKKEIDWEEK